MTTLVTNILAPNKMFDSKNVSSNEIFVHWPIFLSELISLSGDAFLRVFIVHDVKHSSISMHSFELRTITLEKRQHLLSIGVVMVSQKLATGVFLVMERSPVVT
jgi:hypothetical protein